MIEVDHLLWRFDNPEEWVRVQKEEAEKSSSYIEALLNDVIKKEEVIGLFRKLGGALMLNTPTAYSRGRLHKYAKEFLVEKDKSLALIKKFIEDDDPVIRACIIEITRRCGGEAIGHLLVAQLQKEKHEGVLFVILSALEDIGGPESVLALLKIIEKLTPDCFLRFKSCIHTRARRALYSLAVGYCDGCMVEGYPEDELDAPYATPESADTTTMLAVYELTKFVRDKYVNAVNQYQDTRRDEPWFAAGKIEDFNAIVNEVVGILKSFPNNVDFDKVCSFLK